MKAIAEVIDHHRTIEAWLSGRTSDLGGFFDMHTPDFTWYDPDGAMLTLTDLRDAMRKAHGTAPGLRIHIREPQGLLETDDLTVVTYEEHHPDTARRAVAIMVPAPTARNGLLWRTLHESWTRTTPS